MKKESSSKKSKKGVHFNAALTRTFLLTTALPILFLLVIFFLLLFRRTNENNETGFRSNLSILRSSFDFELKNISEFSDAYKSNKKIRTFFYYYYLYHTEDFNSSQMLSYRDKLVDYASAMNAYLKLANPNILGIAFIPSSGELMVYHEKGDRYNTVADHSEFSKSWYQDLLTNPREKVLTFDYSSNLKTPQNVLRLCSSVWNNQNDEVIGYFLVDISPSIFSGSESDISLLKETFLSASFDDLDYIYVSDSAIDAEAIKTAADSGVKKLGDEFYFTMKETSPDYGYTLTYFVPVQMLTSGMLDEFLVMFILFVLLFLLSIFIFSIFSKRVVRSFEPIRNSLSLYRGGERVPKIGDKDYPISEIGDFAAIVDAMIDEIDDHIHKEYMSLLAEKKAEFRALQAEINPHFLYNTLNNFQALNRLGEQKLLEESIQSLSNLFRYTCEKEPTGISTVGNEIHFLENYLQLQKIRYDERLIYSFSIDDRVCARPIPKLILQPLVENAIVHGLEPCDHPVHIQIAASYFPCRGLGDICLLSVINDGCPLDYDHYREDSRVGLTNIEERLKTFWPESALLVKGGPGQLTEFHIIIKEDAETGKAGSVNEDSDRR